MSEESLGGTADVLESPAYKEVRMRLIKALDMSEVREMAESYGSITSVQIDRLSEGFPDQLDHNRELFRMMEIGGKQALQKFSRVLSGMGDHFREDRAKLNQLLQGATREVDRAAVERAIDEYIVTLKRVRIVIVGEFDTGKTNFLRALLGREFVEKGDSTETVKVSRTLFSVSLSAISEVDFTKQPILSAMRQGESLLNIETARALSSNHAEPQQMEQEADAEYRNEVAHADNNIPVETSQSLAEAAERLKGLDIPEEVLVAISQMDESALKDSVYVETWDLGGQMSMAAHQTVCLDSSHALFVLVSDASKGLDDPVTEDIFRYNGGSLTSPAMFPEMTHRSFIQTWLSMISMHQSTTQRQRIPVLVIATHIDVVEKRASGDKEVVEQAKEAYRDAIEKLIKSEATELEVKGIYFVDNRSVNYDPASKYSEMKDVQKQLFKAFKGVDERKVPLLRLKVEKAIGMLNNTDRSQEHSEKIGQSAPCLKYSEFVEFVRFVCKKDVPEKVVQKWLAALHQNAVVYWSNHSNPDGDNLVFLSIEWLLAQFMDIIGCPMKMKLNRVEFSGDVAPHVDYLRDNGFVRPRLLEKLWERHSPAVRDALVSAMIRLNFACDTETSEASMYIPLSVKEPIFKMDDNLKQALPPLKLCISDMYFPPPLFTQLCMLLATSKRIVRKSMKFRYGSMRFSLGGDLGTVRLTWTPSGLVVELFQEDNAEQLSPPVAPQVRSLVNQCLAEMQRKGYKRLSGTPQFLCEASCRYDVSTVDGKWWDSKLCLPWVCADEHYPWCKECDKPVKFNIHMEWFSEMQDGASAERDPSPASAADASIKTASQQDAGMPPSSSADRQDQTRQRNPWESSEYKQCYHKLVEILHPSQVKNLCFSLQLLDKYEMQDIDANPAQHARNSAILAVLSSSPEKFGRFREVLHHLNSVGLERIVEDLDKLGPDREKDQDCLKARHTLGRN